MIHDEEEKKHTRRGWKIILIICGLVIAVVVLAIVSDDPLEDDSAIRPRGPQLDPATGPLMRFAKNVGKEGVSGIETLPKEVQLHENGTEAAMKAFLETKTKAFDAFDEFMTSDPAQWRWPEMSLRHLESEELTICMKMARLLSERARCEALDGQASKSVRTSLKNAQFGHGLLRAEGPLIHYLVACHCFQIGEKALEPAVTNANCKRDDLLLAIADLQGLDPSPLEFGLMLRREREFMQRADQEIREGVPVPNIHGDPAWLNLLTKPNRTSNLHLHLMKPIIEACETSTWREVRRAHEDAVHLLVAWDGPYHRLLLSANAGGNLSTKRNADSQRQLCIRAMADAAFHRQTLIMIALRLYELDKGKLPNLLTELVPTYLRSVPTDPYDDAPMRWNPTRQTIYSVGTNLIDDGGAMKLYRIGSEPDIGLRYWWAPPEADPATTRRKRVK